MHISWPSVLPAAFILLYAIYSIGAISDGFSHDRRWSPILTGVCSLVATTGAIMFLLPTRSAMIVSLWQLLVIPLAICNFALIVFDAKQAYADQSNTKGTVTAGVAIALIMELPCLWFNLAFAFSW